MAANRRRGEVSATVDGRAFRLCLTLGALAELEAAFEVGDIAALGTRFGSGRLSTADLLALFAAGCRGAGEAVAAADLRGLPAAALPAVAAAVADLLVATFGEVPQNPQGPQEPRAP